MYWKVNSMKKFEIPMIHVQRLEADYIITGSECMVEADACLKCYCSGVTCDGTYTCDGFLCPRYDDI